MKKTILQHFSLQFEPQIDSAELNCSVMRRKYQTDPTHLFRVPSNVRLIVLKACGGGSAGCLPDTENKLSGCGGNAGLTVKKTVAVEPGQVLEIRIGRGGHFVSQTKQPSLTSLQIAQGVYKCVEPEATLIVDAQQQNLLLTAAGGAGFSGGRCIAESLRSESGMAAQQNAGTGFCNADNKWIGYGGGGGGGMGGGLGGSVYSNGKTTRASDADSFTGSGGGGSALVLKEQNVKHFLPGDGASGFVTLLYQL